MNSENIEKNEEIIRLFIVDDDNNEVITGQKSFINVEITNEEELDGNFEIEEEYDDFNKSKVSNNDQFGSMLNNIKVEIIKDLEDEFGEINSEEVNEFVDDDSFEIQYQNMVNSLNLFSRREKKTHVCDICGYRTRKKSHFKRHLIVHFKPAGLYCSICKKPMIGKAELNEHMVEHKLPDDRYKYQCHLCSYTSNQLTNVSQHTQVHSKEKKEIHKCDTCNFATTNVQRFENHSMVHLKSKRNNIHQCPVCLMVFKSVILRRQHIQKYRSLEDPTKYQCPECPYKTHKFNNFEQHMVVHRSEFETDMFQCDSCPFRSKRKKDLKQHIIVKHKTDDEVVTYQCDFCSYESRRGDHLTSHMRNRHSKDLIVKKCGLCSYKTVSNVLIERHFNIHSHLPKTYLFCSMCDYGCHSKILLKKHMALKHNNNENEENEIDNLEDKSEDLLEENHGYSFELITVKNEMKAIYCCQFPQCKFQSEIEREAKIHMTISHNKRGEDNRCPECTFHTTSRYLYLDHLKVHDINIEHLKVHDINIEHLKSHLCEVCGTRWIRQGDLTRHMSIHWNSEEDRRKK